MGTILLHVGVDNVVRAVYTDDLVPYIAAVGGELTRTHILPDNGHLHGGNFIVDMQPVSGKMHAVDEENKPFVTYQSAVAFELRWLERFFGIKKGVEHVGALA